MGLSETEKLSVDFYEKLFHRLVDTQRSIRTVGWFSPSAMAWKSARRFKAESGWGIGFVPDVFGRFSVRGNRVITVYGNLRIIEV